jgi:hypothetical protein
VKPVLFASLPDHSDPRPIGPPPEWLTRDMMEPLAKAAPGSHPYRRPGDRLADVVVVVDLSGAEGALLGVALAGHGFSPVPLYNGLWHEQAVIDTGPVMAALVDGARLVHEVPADAPPAFLLDADRLGVGRAIRPGDFDNRWFSTPTDFPSPEVLWGAGLRRLVLVQRSKRWPAADLAPTLIAFQQRGLQLFLLRVGAPAGRALAPLSSVRPPWPVRLGHRIHRLLFPRRDDGAFGLRVPLPSGG